MPHVSEIPFTPLHTDKDVDKLKDWFVKNKEYFGSTANYNFVSAAGRVGEGHFNAGCHAGMNSAANKILVGTEIASKRNINGTNRDFEPYLKWLLYDSFASRFIVNKDDYDFCRDYGIIISTGVHASVVQAICIMSRHFRECQPAAFTKFKQLTENGVHPAVAYSFCFLTYYSYYGEHDTYMNTKVVSYGGHRPFYLPNSVECMNRFMSNTFSEVNDFASPFSEKPSIYGTVNLFRDTPEPYGINQVGFIPEVIKGREDLRELLRVSRNGGNTSYSPPNPFKQPVRGVPNLSPTDITYNELFDIFIPYITDSEKGVFN